MTTKTVLAEVEAERARQEAKWGQQNHPMLSEITNELGHTHRLGVGGYGLYMSADDLKKQCEDRFKDKRGSYFCILMEEVAEAIEAAEHDARTDPIEQGTSRAELVQVAAVAVAMVEAIDRRRAPAPTPPKPEEPKRRTCNMHKDCDAADAYARANGNIRAVHCSSDDCEDCFPK